MRIRRTTRNAGAAVPRYTPYGVYSGSRRLQYGTRALCLNAVGKAVARKVRRLRTIF